MTTGKEVSRLLLKFGTHFPKCLQVGGVGERLVDKRRGKGVPEVRIFWPTDIVPTPRLSPGCFASRLRLQYELSWTSPKAFGELQHSTIRLSPTASIMFIA
jgi:hypothetical protein